MGTITYIRKFVSKNYKLFSWLLSSGFQRLAHGHHFFQEIDLIFLKALRHWAAIDVITIEEVFVPSCP